MKSNFGLTVKEEESIQSNEEKKFEDMLIKAGAKGSYMVFNEFMEAPKHLRIIDEIAKKELYKVWLTNFRSNLTRINTGLSATALPRRKKDRAVIVGAGPSLEKNKHRLNRTEIDSFDIFCTDRALERLDITPIEFAVSVDADQKIAKYYNGKKYEFAIIPITISPAVQIDGFKRWYIPSIDAQTDRILQIMTGLPIIQSYGNVGATACSIAEYLAYKEIILVGMDFGYADGTKYEDMDWFNKLKEAGGEEAAYKAHQAIEHPIFKTITITDPIFDAYRAAFYGFLNQTKCKVINATEGGSLYHPKLESMTLEQALTNSHRS